MPTLAESSDRDQARFLILSAAENLHEAVRELDRDDPVQQELDEALLAVRRVTDALGGR